MQPEAGRHVLQYAARAKFAGAAAIGSSDFYSAVPPPAAQTKKRRSASNIFARLKSPFKKGDKKAPTVSRSQSEGDLLKEVPSDPAAQSAGRPRLMRPSSNIFKKKNKTATRSLRRRS